MVGELDFGLAAAVERDAGGDVLGCWLEPGPRPPQGLVEAATAGLAFTPAAGTFAHGAPAALAPLAAALGFELCFWLRAPLWAGAELVLCAGASPRTAPYQRLDDDDRAHFVMLGNHLAAHLTNGTVQYASHTVWTDEDAFRAWVGSEAFRKAHAQGSLKDVIAGPPRLAGWTSVDLGR